MTLRKMVATAASAAFVLIAGCAMSDALVTAIERDKKPRQPDSLVQDSQTRLIYGLPLANQLAAGESDTPLRSGRLYSRYPPASLTIS